MKDDDMADGGSRSAGSMVLSWSRFTSRLDMMVKIEGVV
jgi:hypothetical protein